MRLSLVRHFRSFCMEKDFIFPFIKRINTQKILNSLFSYLFSKPKKYKREYEKEKREKIILQTPNKRYSKILFSNFLLDTKIPK